MDDQPVVDERRKYVDGLKAELETISAGQAFEVTGSGKLIIKILQADVDRFTNDVLSDKFIDNHMGYVDARAKANYAASILNRLQRVKSPAKEKEVREKLDLAENEPGV